MAAAERMSDLVSDYVEESGIVHVDGDHTLKIPKVTTRGPIWDPPGSSESFTAQVT